MVKKNIDNKSSNSNHGEEKNKDLDNILNLNNIDNENFKEEALFVYNAINEGTIDLNPEEKEEILQELDLILNHIGSSNPDDSISLDKINDNSDNESDFQSESDDSLNVGADDSVVSGDSVDVNGSDGDDSSDESDDSLNVDVDDSVVSGDSVDVNESDGDDSSDESDDSLNVDVDDSVVSGDSVDVNESDGSLNEDNDESDESSDSMDVNDSNGDDSSDESDIINDVDDKSSDKDEDSDDLSVDDALSELISDESSSSDYSDQVIDDYVPAEDTEVLTPDIPKDLDSDESLSVDDALNDLIVNYSNEVAIKVENISMKFTVSKDKIDTLKEFVIRTIKRNKSSSRTIVALDDVSFEIPKGDRVGIIGFNGAGKSTLLKVLSGVYDATEGTIETKGKIAPLLELGAGFDNNYTGKDNIFLNGAFLGYSEEFLNEKYDEILEFSELGDAINYHVKTYSSGMRAKLAFSIATIVEPDILIIDEILSVGDIKFKKKSADKIRSLINSGITVLLVSHSIGQIRDLCNKAMWIDEGKLRMYGEVNEVCDAYVKASREATYDQLKDIDLN